MQNAEYIKLLNTASSEALHVEPAAPELEQQTCHATAATDYLIAHLPTAEESKN